MPFGLSNAGRVYSRMLDLALVSGRHSGILHGHLGPPKTSEEHCGGSHEGRDQDSTKKTKIFQTETEYLGHKVSQSWPRPTSCKEMSSFLGFTGYYRGFIPRYSALTNRMNSLKNVEKFVWTEDMEKDFLELKAEFSAGR